MKIVITGHMGFIGSYLYKDIDAIGLDKKEGNNILNCDLPDADIVIHLAAEASVLESIKNPFNNAFTNILGTIRLAQRYKNARFIFASTGGAIQETIESPYGLSKFCAEEYIKMMCKDYVILRFPNVYGNGSRSVVDKFLNQDKNTIYGTGKAMRTYCHVDDIVDAICLAFRWPKGLYKLGTDQNYNVLQIAEAVGKDVEFIDKIEGELDFSHLDNTSLGWNSKIDLMDYILENK